MSRGSRLEATAARRIPGLYGSDAAGRFYFQCTREGQIIWAGEAPARFPQGVNLFDSLPAARRWEAQLFLKSANEFFRFGLRSILPEDTTGRSEWIQLFRLTSAGNTLLILGVVPRSTERPMAAGARWQQISGEMERSAARNYFRLQQAAARLETRRRRPRRSLGELLTAELERERSRIARELHAGVGQPLAGIKLNLELMRSTAAESKLQEWMDRLQLLADQALEQVRAVSHRLHPPDWQALNLKEALESLLDLSGISLKAETDIEIDDLPEPPHAIKVALYRCVQECISNVSRHSQATSFVLRLTESEGWISLVVQDNGVGFDANALLSGARKASHGIGILAMQEQIAALNGKMEVSSGPGNTKIQIKMPTVED